MQTRKKDEQGEILSIIHENQMNLGSDTSFEAEMNKEINKLTVEPVHNFNPFKGNRLPVDPNCVCIK